MALTFAQFRTGVQGLYNAGADMTIMVYQAASCYVKSRVEKEVNQDLERAKSYMNEYLELKVKLAGTTIAPNFATVKANVLTRITVDSQRTAISAYVDLYIQEAMDDLNAVKVTFDSFLKDCLIDLQRKVIGYQQNNQSFFLAAGVTNSGFSSKIDLTALSNPEIIGVSVGRYQSPLAVQAYAANDLLQSNGRIYKCVTTGVVAAVGTGLLSTNGNTETLGTAGFQFIETIGWTSAYPVLWLNRDQLSEHTLPGGGFSYTVDPQTNSLYFFPLLTQTDRQLRLEYNGLKDTFLEADMVTFGVSAQSVAADFVKSHLVLQITGDRTLAQSHLMLYAAGVRRLWTDNTRRQVTLLSK